MEDLGFMIQRNLWNQNSLSNWVNSGVEELAISDDLIGIFNPIPCEPICTSGLVQSLIRRRSGWGFILEVLDKSRFFKVLGSVESVFTFLSCKLLDVG